MVNGADILIAVGSNQPSGVGGARETVAAALDLLVCEGAKIAARSRDYRTSAYPPGSGPDFVNAAAVLRWALAPDAILVRLHRVEAALGRQRQVRWGPRTVDLDLIAVGGAVLPDDAGHAFWRALPPERQAQDAPETLVLPHPRIQDRAFVLVPLADVAPGWVHPSLGLTVTEMLAALDPGDVADVRALD
ncbi:MAG: 2-amino-4-hydroxy-6-hydroxymethyldihydropteridine diphosphokinase [Pseudomonadota bacterium]